MSTAKARVQELLDYVEQVERLRQSPHFSIPDAWYVGPAHLLALLPEVQFDLRDDGDEIWIRMPRLVEIAPPDPGERLRPLIDRFTDPVRPPQLKRRVTSGSVTSTARVTPSSADCETEALFRWYLEFLWHPWSAAEIPRRQCIAHYNRLFGLHQSITLGGTSQPVELVCGIGHALWQRDGLAKPVSWPLLIQPCEISIDEQTFDLEIRRREVPPRLEIDCLAELGLPGVVPLEEAWRRHFSGVAYRVSPFNPDTFESVLRAAVGHLDPAGKYVPCNMTEPPPEPGPTLTVTGSWVFFGRQRSADVLIEDARRFKRAVEQCEDLPSVVRALVEPGSAQVRVQPEVPLRGLQSSDWSEAAQELYFPMAYNEEQAAIVRKLANNDGVVVQGPPGTGKTHTIANVICHYLALGKRVLVTSCGESALAVLQAKLPERIRPLCAALIADDREGLRHFAHAIVHITQTLSTLDPVRTERAIRSTQADLDRLHAAISAIDQSIRLVAEQHDAKRSYRGAELFPAQMAVRILEERLEHAWFDDDVPVDGEVPLTPDEVLALRTARMLVTTDLAHVGQSIPTPDILPDPDGLCALHADLIRADVIDRSVANGTVPDLPDRRPETMERARALSDWLAERSDVIRLLKREDPAWVGPLLARLRQLSDSGDLVRLARELAREVVQLEEARARLLSRAIEVPIDAELDEKFVRAVDRRTEGRGRLLPVFETALVRRQIGAVRIEGFSPASADHWRAVRSLVQWRRAARQVTARWVAIGTDLRYPSPEGQLDASFQTVVRWQGAVSAAMRFEFEFSRCFNDRVAAVFGPLATPPAPAGASGVHARVIAQALTTHLEKARLAPARRRREALLETVAAYSGPIVDRLREFFCDVLGRASVPADALVQRRNELASELRRLVAHGSSLREIWRLASVIEEAGAPRWAARVRAEPATGHLDPVVPVKSAEAWQWRRAVRYLDSIDQHRSVRTMLAARDRYASELAGQYERLVADRAWLGVFNNAPDRVRQALQAFATAAQNLRAGSNTQKAQRYRPAAREAMATAYRAMPCWVLPQWRVAETLPAEIGSFDLVVVDEASQSDVSVLPVLLRGRKVLVVGDDKQVSPSLVGVPAQQISALAQRFLANQPFGRNLGPDSSIYELASTVFAGNSVMLQEHFRSVPPIIAYSNREYYGGQIRPLRVPAAHERLDPPLIDVVVKGGCRAGDINKPEARAIVDEIATVIADPHLSGRSIGVVTLLGTKQADYIWQLLTEAIPQAEIIARNISVGPPPVFQGRERDIMMISMVLEPGDRSLPRQSGFEQRLNVALSRARDRMYLFRSISDANLPPDSLSAGVIRHFRQPVHTDPRVASVLRARCESDFEREMFDELSGRGYRVEPQVKCGPYSIDLVVEGAQGRRLAIECDGDRFHTGQRWREDMARQRVLERAGWTVWRCFASSFVRQRTQVLDDLDQTFHRLGIDPLGPVSAATVTLVQYREVDPFGPEDRQAPEVQP